MQGNHFNKKFSELTNEFVDFALEVDVSKPFGVMQCHNKRHAPSKRFGSKCGCMFLYKPSFASTVCQNRAHGLGKKGCGMRLEPVPIPPRCPECNSTNVRFADDSGVEEEELQHMTMTGRQSMVGKVLDIGDYDPVDNDDDEEQEPIRVLHDDSDKTLEPRFPDYLPSTPYYEPKTVPIEDSLKMQDATAIDRHISIWSEKQPMTQMQINTSRKHFGVTPNHKLSRYQISKIMKRLFWYTQEIENPVLSPYEKQEIYEEFHMWLGRLKTGNMYAGESSHKDRIEKIPYRKRDYTDWTHSERFMEIILDDVI